MTSTKQLTMEEILKRQMEKKKSQHRLKSVIFDSDSDSDVSLIRSSAVAKKPNSAISTPRNRLSLRRKRKINESSESNISEAPDILLDSTVSSNSSSNNNNDIKINANLSFASFTSAVNSSNLTTPKKNKPITKPTWTKSPSSASKRSKKSPFTHNKITTPSPKSKQASNLKQTKLYSPQSRDMMISNVTNQNSQNAIKHSKKLFADTNDNDGKPSCSKQHTFLKEECSSNNSNACREKRTLIESQATIKRLKLSLNNNATPSCSNGINISKDVQIPEVSESLILGTINPAIEGEQVAQNEQDNSQQRRHRFLKKIPNVFEDLMAQFTNLPKDSRVKSYRPGVQLLPEIREQLGFGNKDHGDEQSKNIPEDESQESQRLAYYWSNFLEISKAVLDEPDDRRLFNDDDIKTIRKYYTSSENAQQLYARLFVRRHKFLQDSDIRYPEISKDLEPVLDELISMEYLDGADRLTDLDTALHLLSFRDVKQLCNAFNVKSDKTKAKNILALLENCSKHMPLFGGTNGEVQRRNGLLKRALEMLGRCCRVADKPRSVFRRIMMLYSLSDTCWDSKQNENQPAQLTNLMHVNMGKLVFPSYELQRKAIIFRDRNDLLQYETAFTLEGEILTCMQDKKWNDALKLCNEAMVLYRALMNDQETLNHDVMLPDFLRQFTAGYLLIRCLNYRVDVLQKLKCHEEANIQIEDLLNQKVYCQHYRGYWMDRFALNAHQHLKLPLQALKMIGLAQNDLLVTDDHLLSLSARAERIRSGKQVDPSLFDAIKTFKMPKVAEVMMNGQKLDSAISGLKSSFYYETYNGDVEVCSVERFALLKYSEQGFIKGLHAEGSLLVSLFGLLFWDIIYTSGISDAFRSPHQAFPLDLTSDFFLSNREAEIESRFGFLNISSVEEVAALVEKNWKENEGKASIVSWSSLSCDDILSLVSCMGKDCLSKIFERLVKNFRHCRSGLPDLTVWNPTTKMWKMIEVKGPGDKLSNKQIIWLNFLTSIGVSAEVCYVHDYGGKKVPCKAVDQQPNFI